MEECKKHEVDCEARLKVVGISEPLRIALIKELTAISQRLTGLHAEIFAQRRALNGSAGKKMNCECLFNYLFRVSFLFIFFDRDC